MLTKVIVIVSVSVVSVLALFVMGHFLNKEQDEENGQGAAGGNAADKNAAAR